MVSAPGEDIRGCTCRAGHHTGLGNGDPEVGVARQGGNMENDSHELWLKET